MLLVSTVQQNGSAVHITCLLRVGLPSRQVPTGRWQLSLGCTGRYHQSPTKHTVLNIHVCNTEAPDTAL